MKENWIKILDCSRQVGVSDQSVRQKVKRHKLASKTINEVTHVDLNQVLDFYKKNPPRGVRTYKKSTSNNSKNKIISMPIHEPLAITDVNVNQMVTISIPRTAALEILKAMVR